MLKKERLVEQKHFSPSLCRHKLQASNIGIDFVRRD